MKAQLEKMMNSTKPVIHMAPFAHLLYEGSNFKVWRETLPAGQSLDWHYHSEIMDMFYVVKGPLEIQLRAPERAVVLEAGTTYKVDKMVQHKVVNRTIGEVEWLLIQGLGKVDFRKAEASE